MVNDKQCKWGTHLNSISKETMNISTDRVCEITPKGGQSSWTCEPSSQKIFERLTSLRKYLPKFMSRVENINIYIGAALVPKVCQVITESNIDDKCDCQGKLILASVGSKGVAELVHIYHQAQSIPEVPLVKPSKSQILLIRIFFLQFSYISKNIYLNLLMFNKFIIQLFWNWK